MRDEHFYTRSMKLDPKNAVDYYLGRADFYCLEQNYDKAYRDLCEAVKLGADVSENFSYKICKDYIDADENIIKLTKKIEENPKNTYAYYKRSHYYLLQNKSDKAFSDIIKMYETDKCVEFSYLINELCDKIKERNVNNTVKNANKKQLTAAYKQRIEYAEEQILISHNREYWQYRAEHDLEEIYNLSKDKALALYLRVNFYERIKNIGNAIFYCKKVLDASKIQKDKTLTYLYATKLIALYANEEKYDKAMQIAVFYPEKPVSEDLKKGLKYINNFASMDVDVLRKNRRTSFKRKYRGK